MLFPKVFKRCYNGADINCMTGRLDNAIDGAFLVGIILRLWVLIYLILLKSVLCMCTCLLY